MDRVFLFPGAGLHLLEARADDDLDLLAAEAARGAAAVHGGVAATQDDDPPADLLDVAEGDAGEPVDADMDVGGGLLAARDVEVPAAGRAGPDEHRVEAFGQEALEALDALAQAKLDTAEAGDVADLLVDHFLGQAEARDLAADHATRARLAVEQDQLVAQGGEVAGDRERGGTGAHQGHALSIPLGGDRRHQGPDIGLVVGGHALEPADGHRLLLHPAAPAGGLAGAVAGAAENAREDVRLPVDHVGVIVPAIGDQADVFRHGGVGRTGPLAVDHLVIVVGTFGTRWLQDPFPPRSPGVTGPESRVDPGPSPPRIGRSLHS